MAFHRPPFLQILFSREDHFSFPEKSIANCVAFMKSCALRCVAFQDERLMPMAARSSGAYDDACPHDEIRFVRLRTRSKEQNHRGISAVDRLGSIDTKSSSDRYGWLPTANCSSNLSRQYQRENFQIPRCVDPKARVFEKLSTSPLHQRRNILLALLGRIRSPVGGSGQHPFGIHPTNSEHRILGDLGSRQTNCFSAALRRHQLLHLPTW